MCLGTALVTYLYLSGSKRLITHRSDAKLSNTRKKYQANNNKQKTTN
jgi:hypothetical protein